MSPCRIRGARFSASARGITLFEVVVATALVLILLAVLVPMLAAGGHRSGTMVSANNLRRLGTAAVAYETDWNGQQWNMLPSDLGTQWCAEYTANHCASSPTMGVARDGLTWAWWIPSGVPDCIHASSASCDNFGLLMPIRMPSSGGGFADLMASFSRFPNLRGPREYVAARFYDPVFYAPNDPSIARIASKLQHTQFEFDHQSGEEIVPPTYCFSPPTLMNPKVFGRPVFRAPRTWAKWADPLPVSAATYPSLKTRIMEHDWCSEGQELLNRDYITPAARVCTLAVNSRPGALYFDGRVSFTTMQSFRDEDKPIFQQDQVGLWHRGSNFGVTGYTPYASGGLGAVASPHFLTVEGILGRDVVEPR